LPDERTQQDALTTAMSRPKSAIARLTPRALIVGLVLVGALCVAIPYTTGFMNASELGGCHFPVGPLFLLVVLTIVFGVLGHVWRRCVFNAQETLIVTAMMMVAAGIPSFGLALYLFPILTAPFYMASAENKWEATFFEYLPTWIAPEPGSAAIRWFYDGTPPGATPPWGEWVVPLLAWTILTFGLYLAMFSIGAIVRKQWVERENLIFPLVQLPLEMVMSQRHEVSPVPFFSNKLTWVGIAIPFLIHNMNALHGYMPGVPYLQLQGNTVLTGLTSRPWLFLRSPLTMHFSVVGFAYFLTTEISLSLWVFWWLGRIQHVAADAFGRQAVLRKVEENQYQGAFIVYVLYGLWVARGHLSAMWDTFMNRGERKTVHENSRHEERPLAMSTPVAFWGLIIGGAIVVVWLNVAGMSLLVALATYAIFLVICWGMARLVVESGILFAKAVQMRPTVLLTGLGGSRHFSPVDLTILSFTEYVYMYDLKSFLMPQIMHSLKIADEGRIDRRHMYWAVGIAVFVAVLASYWSSLNVAYSKGALAMHPWFFLSGPRGNVELLKNMLTSSSGPEIDRIVALSVGAAVCAGLIRMRQMFLWFPLHPIAYVVGNGYEASRMWFPFLLGWSAKALVTRYGSIGLYRLLQAPFLGLVVGEYVVAGIWLIIDAITGKTSHRVFP